MAEMQTSHPATCYALWIAVAMLASDRSCKRTDIKFMLLSRPAEGHTAWASIWSARNGMEA